MRSVGRARETGVETSCVLHFAVNTKSDKSLHAIEKTFHRMVFLACSLLSFSHSEAQNPTPATQAEHYLKQQQTAQQLYKTGQLAAYAAHLQAMSQEYPYKSNLLPRLAAAYLQVGQEDKANQTLQRFAQMGGTLAFRDPNLKEFRDSGKLASLSRIENNGKPHSSGSRLFALTDSNLLAEDIAYDPKTARVFLSSVHERKILSCASTGTCETFAANSPQLPLLGVLALRVDAPRRVLWATSVGMKAVADVKEAEDGRSSLLKFDLDSRKLLARFEAPRTTKRALGDMTLGADGTVYVADGLSGDVFTLKAGAAHLEELVPHGTFVSPQTPAISQDGSLLYVPDYTMGIAAIQLHIGKVEWLTGATPVALDCIDGLYVVGNNLLAVQNGTQPERIISFHLHSPNQIDSFKILEANWKGLGDPTHGVSVGNIFYFIVNSGWDRMDEDGRFAAGAPAEVWKLDLGRL